MKVRVKFRKYGPVRFIGHLDVMRFFQKCIRRAGIDVAYTTGFSPHQIMSFAAPLGVGLTSDGEYMDIECNSVTTSQDMLERLNRASAPGIEMVSVVLLPEGAGNAMASVAAAGYTVRFREGREPSFDYMGKLAEFYALPEILVTKETRKNTLTVDIRPGIYELQADPYSRSIHMLLDASSGGNIKPRQVMDAYAVWQGEALAEHAYTIHREDTYLNLAAEGAPQRLAPMDAIGSPILEPMVDEERIRIAREAQRRKEDAAEEAKRLRREALAAKETEQREWLLHSADKPEQRERIQAGTGERIQPGAEERIQAGTGEQMQAGTGERIQTETEEWIQAGTGERIQAMDSEQNFCHEEGILQGTENAGELR